MRVRGEETFNQAEGFYPAEGLLDGPRVRFEFVGFHPSAAVMRTLKSTVRRFLRSQHWGFRMKASFVAVCGRAFQVTLEAREGLQYGISRAYGSELRELLKNSLDHLKLAPDDEWTSGPAASA